MNAENIVITTKGTFTLQREEFSDIGISICLPESFRDLPDDEKQQNVTIQGMVRIIRADMENKFVFAINSADKEVKPDQTEDEVLKQFMSKQQKALSSFVSDYKGLGIKDKIEDFEWRNYEAGIRVRAEG